MNIEIANHLVELRKKSGLSQEQLAAKLGLSRQSVSKWERAEASPDTDNLIALAKLYGVSLNELLLMQEDEEQPEPTQDEQAEEQPKATPDSTQDTDGKKEGVHIGLDGIHVEDGTDSVHVGWQGVHVETPTDHVHVSKEGVFVQTADGEAERHMFHHDQPRSTLTRVLSACYPILTVLIFFLLGAAGWWHPGWLVFLTIPLYYTLVEAIRKRNAKIFAYPVLMVIVFLCLGFFLGWWAWGWIVFLTIPVYYALFPDDKE